MNIRYPIYEGVYRILTFIQWIQNRIIGQYGNRQPAVSYERLSLPGRVDTVDDSTESGFISL